MSWSFDGIGKPAALAAAIDKGVDSYGPAVPNNYSRQEFEEAAPHLKALIAEADPESVVEVRAGGSATWLAGRRSGGDIRVSIRTIGKLLQA